jgi:hypothetical protein
MLKFSGFADLTSCHGRDPSRMENLRVGSHLDKASTASEYKEGYV